ncbi:TlpA disulfide reductase family protein [Arachidicoccus ginsenosidimutans]|uniref:TlpA disulfide reductase family protein n=1 Tax=Arachidicoccus sp. BS20 TaxID=1850526 RepID=UPI0018D3F9E7|nr:TlpA disulfide reductase family protein [Arachidicoccus sp. BS20]
MRAQTLADTTGIVTSSKEIYRYHTGKEQAAAYKVFTEKYPESIYGNLFLLNDLKTFIAMTYAWEGNEKQAGRFMDSLNHNISVCSCYFRLATAFQNVHNLVQAEKYASRAIDSAIAYLSRNTENVEDGLQPPTIVAAAAILQANLYSDEHQYNMAIDCLDKAIPYCSEKNVNGMLLLKGDIAAKGGKFQEALNVYRHLLKNGNESIVLKSKMATAYMSLHHLQDSTGFTAYYTNLLDKYHRAFLDSLSHSTAKEKAQDFKMKDINGKEVSLHDFLGKVVILDFWATWCVPCKASFPAMQAAIDKYKKDTNVVFLFIDTWEYGNDTQAAVKNFLNAKHYDFQVLFDNQNKTSKQYEAVNDYKITGVPTKFVIDKNGYIRFKLTGYNGNIESSLSELSVMISAAMR